MRHSLFSAEFGNGRLISIAHISLDAFEENSAHALGDDTGYFIYEIDMKRESAGIEILAKTVSYDAAIRIADILASRITK